MAIDPNAQAAYRRARDKVGIEVTFVRQFGAAPKAKTFSAKVTAVVRNYTPDGASVGRTDSSSSKQGAITQGDREIIVLAEDLATKRFPLPVKKNDKVVLVDTGEQLNIVAVDALKRAMAGAIECKASGVQ
jgi:hypothetical protein